MSDRVSPEDLMRYFDEEASEEERERVCRMLTTCGSLQEEVNQFGVLRAELRALRSELLPLLPTLEQPQASIWELVRDRLQIGRGRAGLAMHSPSDSTLDWSRHKWQQGSEPEGGSGRE